MKEKKTAKESPDPWPESYKKRRHELALKPWMLWDITFRFRHIKDRKKVVRLLARDENEAYEIMAEITGGTTFAKPADKRIRRKVFDWRHTAIGRQMAAWDRESKVS